MKHDEIARDIVIAMIAKGHFDSTDNRSSYEDVQKARTNAICETYKQIAKTAMEVYKEQH